MSDAVEGAASTLVILSVVVQFLFCNFLNYWTKSLKEVFLNLFFGYSLTRFLPLCRTPPRSQNGICAIAPLFAAGLGCHVAACIGLWSAPRATGYEYEFILGACPMAGYKLAGFRADV